MDLLGAGVPIWRVPSNIRIPVRCGYLCEHVDSVSIQEFNYVQLVWQLKFG